MKEEIKEEEKSHSLSHLCNHLHSSQQGCVVLHKTLAFSLCRSGGLFFVKQNLHYSLTAQAVTQETLLSEWIPMPPSPLLSRTDL